MVRLDLLEAQLSVKDEWRSVFVAHGALYVMIFGA